MSTVKREFLTAIGFKDAGQLTDEKLTLRLRNVIDDVDETVTETELYKRVVRELIEMEPKQEDDGEDLMAGRTLQKKRQVVPTLRTRNGIRIKKDGTPEKRRGRKKGVTKGVCYVISERVRRASARKPVSKDELLEILVEEFPERDSIGMKATVSGFPSWLPAYSGIHVERNERGYFPVKGV